MVLHIPADCYPEKWEKIFVAEVTPGLHQKNFEFSTDRKGEAMIIAVRIPSITPKTKLNVSLPFRITPLIARNFNISSQAKDRVPVEVTLKISIMQKFAIVLYPEESEPIYCRMNVGAILANSLKKGVEKHISMLTHKDKDRSRKVIIYFPYSFILGQEKSQNSSEIL